MFVYQCGINPRPLLGVKKCGGQLGAVLGIATRALLWNAHNLQARQSRALTDRAFSALQSKGTTR